MSHLTLRQRVHRFKLTVITRLFYVWPKEFLLWLYFKALRDHKHTKFILFENLICDVAFAIKNMDKSTPPNDYFNLAQDPSLNPSVYSWYKKNLYQTNDFYENTHRGFMTELENKITLWRPKTVLDIGCGNGARLDRLATKFPDVRFYGLDFIVKFAVEANEYRNVSYLEGYPLHCMKTHEDGADMIFATQALLFALPKELEEYFKEFERLGVKFIAIFDTNINGYRQKNDGKIWSKHMGYNTAFCHNYSGYFKKYGFNVSDFNIIRSDFHPSRSDYDLVSIFGTKKGLIPK